MDDWGPYCSEIGLHPAALSMRSPVLEWPEVNLCLDINLWSLTTIRWGEESRVVSPSSSWDSTDFPRIIGSLFIWKIIYISWIIIPMTLKGTYPVTCLKHANNTLHIFSPLFWFLSLIPFKRILTSLFTKGLAEALIDIYCGEISSQSSSSNRCLNKSAPEKILSSGAVIYSWNNFFWVNYLCWRFYCNIPHLLSQGTDL